MIIGEAVRRFRMRAPGAEERFVAPLDIDLVDSRYWPTQAGQTVTVESSKNIATAYRCINVLSDDVAALPFQTFASRRPGDIQRVTASPQMQNIAWLMEISPNRWMTPLIFKKMAIMWLLTHGAAYIWSPLRRPGQRRELFVLRSDKTIPVFDVAGDLYYKTEFANGEEAWLPDVEVLPLLINSQDGISGRSVIGYARETLGRQLGAHETQSRFYQQGLNPSGILWMAGDADKEAREKVRKAYTDAMGGSGNAYRLAVIDQKISKFEAITMKPEDAQFLQSIQDNDTQIANFFGMPLYKLNMGKQSYESNEQQDLDYLKTTLNPYMVQWEQAAAIKWLTEVEQNYTYFRFNRDALLQTDAKTRAETIERRIFSGQLTPNEGRQIEDMPSYQGGDGHYIPANMAVVRADGSLASGNAASGQ